MKLFGITGGLGMGKSTAQSLLARRGVSVVDTDQIARDLVAPDQPAHAEIQSEFGPAFINPDGTLNRQTLAEKVFADAQARQLLESILHPRIRACWQAEVEGWRRQEVALGAVVIPLLFETDAASSFDFTVCVACSAALQLQRLGERGWTEGEIQRRLAAQWPVQRKVDASDHVVWTDGSMDVHAAQWDRLLRSV